MAQKYKITIYTQVNAGTNTKRITEIRNLTYWRAKEKKEELIAKDIEFKIEVE